MKLRFMVIVILSLLLLFRQSGFVYLWHLQCTNNYGAHESDGPWFNDGPYNIKDCNMTRDNSEKFQMSPGDTTVQYITINGLNINFIPVEIFEIFPNILVFEWYGGNITELNREYFERASQLKKLIIVESELRNLGECSFADLVELELLDLTNNRIEVINPNSFRGLENLQHLILDGNNVKELNETVFNQLFELESIYFQQNEIAKLPSNLFSNNRNLKTVDFQNNEIEVISPMVFKEKFKLENINLLNNTCVNETFALANEEDFDNMKDQLITCFINHPVNVLVHEKFLKYRQSIESLASKWHNFIIKLGNKVF